VRCDDFTFSCDVRRRWWGEIVAVFGVEGDAFDRSVTRSVITHAIADLQDNKTWRLNRERVSVQIKRIGVGSDQDCG